MQLRASDCVWKTGCSNYREGIEKRMRLSERMERRQKWINERTLIGGKRNAGRVLDRV